VNDGATVVPNDGREIGGNNDPCVRYVKDAEGVAQKTAMGAHKWLWEDLLRMRVCSTCGVRRPFTGRFQE
jgi:hypothetical protein